MSRSLVLRAAAQAEFDEAFDYYERQRAGYGVKFANQVQKVFDRIGANPDLHRPIFADTRKAAVSRFPYSVYYRDEMTRVEVIAVFHTSRDPAIWKGRN